MARYAIMSFSFRERRAWHRSISATSLYSGMHHLVEGKLGFIAPMPSVLEGFNLCARFLAGGATKQNVVRGLTVEWGIEVNQIHALSVDAAAQNVEIVAVVESDSSLGSRRIRRSELGYQDSRRY
jgi:hypothetical protein